MPHPYPALSPLDFERLCADLLGAAFGTRFETFAARRDGGIDLRCHTDDGLVIGQAKHYQDRAALIRTMRTEKDKLAQIWPARYLLMTSCALASANKDTLLEILAPYCRSSADVYGRDELDVALARHPAVLWRHFKLWLQDGAQPLNQLAQHYGCLITRDAVVSKTTPCSYVALQIGADAHHEVHVLRRSSGIQRSLGSAPARAQPVLHARKLAPRKFARHEGSAEPGADSAPLFRWTRQVVRTELHFNGALFNPLRIAALVTLCPLLRHRFFKKHFTDVHTCGDDRQQSAHQLAHPLEGELAKNPTTSTRS